MSPDTKLIIAFRVMTGLSIFSVDRALDWGVKSDKLFYVHYDLGTGVETSYFPLDLIQKISVYRPNKEDEVSEA